MVVQAYILVQTEVGKAAEVAREIRRISGVTLAEDVTGPYDVIVRAEAASDGRARDSWSWSASRAFAGITRTVTCPVVHL